MVKMILSDDIFLKFPLKLILGCQEVSCLNLNKNMFMALIKITGFRF